MTHQILVGKQRKVTSYSDYFVFIRKINIYRSYAVITMNSNYNIGIYNFNYFLKMLLTLANNLIYTR